MLSKILKNILLILFLLQPIFNFGSTFKLDTSEAIQGKLIEMSLQKTKIQTPYGIIEIPTQKIKAMDFSGETINYIITLNDNSKVNGNIMSLEGEYFTLNTGAGIITIEKKNIAYLVEKDYEKKMQLDKKNQDILSKSKEIEEIESRINQIWILGGYGLLNGDFKGLYKNPIIGSISYDRAFLEGFKQLKLGLSIQYQTTTAEGNSSVKMQILSGMIQLRFTYPLAQEGALSNIAPFIKIGFGESLIQLDKLDGSQQAGLNPCLLGGLGFEFKLSNRINLILESDYLIIIESSKKYQSINLLGGIGYKF